MSDTLISPTARARFVVTLPPEPSRIAVELEKQATTSFTTLTDTRDAFVNLSRRAKGRLVVMTPYIDFAGASWAADMFETTSAPVKELILREVSQLAACGSQGQRLKNCVTAIHDYAFRTYDSAGQHNLETFHAKIVLADGNAAYVGSANFLYRSRELNLECGFLLEGDAVSPVAVLVDAVLAMFKSPTIE